ncbi:MAG TPA: PCRF domain-containing protein, partial [Limnobacter sp.]|nr:PCRF domain-containing protein [Limnobacter sp.]
MKDSMRSRLERLTQRLADLDQFLSSQEAAQDMVLFKNVTRERSELLPATERYAEYLSLEADLKTAQEWLQDPDMRDMAREEIASNEGKLTGLEAELQRLLLPKDPNDHRNVMLEIRAGT